MEENIGTHTCNTNFDDLNNKSQYENVKFRRCFGNVKLSPRPDEDAATADEFDVIIDKIQDVNEDVVLTRECNNFDLVSINCSQNSLPSSKCYYVHSDINKIEDLLSSNLNFFSATDQIEIKPGEESGGKINLGLIGNPSSNDQDKTSLNEHSYSDHLIEKVHVDEQEETISDDINPDPPEKNCSEQEVSEFLEKDQPLQDFKISKPYTENILAKAKPLSMSEDVNSLQLSNSTDMSSTYDEKILKSELPEELDSDDSSKWDRKNDENEYNARFFYNPGNPGGDNFVDKCKINLNHSLTDNVSATLVNPSTKDYNEPEEKNLSSPTRESYFNDSFDNDSVRSLGTSRSDSSTFESAMSSNDMMSPFGTPRNSLSKHSSVGASRGRNMKKRGINFASLTSENIPNTLNRISMHRYCEKNVIKSTVNFEKKERELNSVGVTQNKIHGTNNSLRKLLNLTSHKKLNNQSDMKIPEKIPAKKQKSDENQMLQKDSLKSITLKSRDKKINIKEFYSSRRKKLKSLVETEKLDAHLATFYNEDADSSFPSNYSAHQNTQLSFNQSNNNLESSQHTKVGLPETVFPPQSRENKSKFVSKIPRPISRREINHNILAQNSNECPYEVRPQLNRTSSANLAIKSNRSEKSDTRSRPSDGSEASYKHQNSALKVRDDKLTFKNGSKILVNTAQIDSLRSKYWMKEDKVKFSPAGSIGVKKEAKKQEIIDKDNKKIKSILNVACRQDSKIAYGKMVRVKTAPQNKSAMQIREKSLIKEPSKAETNNPWKSGRKPFKVVSIGALDVNKVS